MLIALVELEHLRLGTLETGTAVADIHDSVSGSAMSLSRSSTVSFSSVPIGLSGKELARLRAEALVSRQTVSRQTDTPSESSESQSEPATAPVVTVEQSAAVPESETQGLQSVVESLWREVRQLRTERLDAPPSYDP